jgi:endonuclease-8
LPEGDTIFRAARALHRALAGRTVTHFESVFPRLTRVDADRPLRGRTVDRVESRGKHLLFGVSAVKSKSPADVARRHRRVREAPASAIS